MPTNWVPLPDGLTTPARELAQELRSLKDARGWTLADLGSRTHYARSSWERWLNGKRLVTRSALANLARAAEVDEAPLLGLWERAAGGAGPAEPAVPVPAEPPAAAATPPVPSQLPPDAPDFTGRTAEVERLAGALTATAGGPGSPAVATVTGGGGLGKTTLAVHAAHLVAHRFPDGRLYVDLRGADANPRHPADVLAAFLRDLGVPPREVPDDLEGRTARFRSEVSGRRLLILLDNARDTAQIRPLLPAAAGCAVLSTSRGRLSGLPGAHRLDLDLLPVQDARRLLASILGAERAAAEPAAVSAVTAGCAGLPLALRIAGARLAERPTWSIAGFAARLADRRRTLDELSVSDLAIRASFDLSYRYLLQAAASTGRVRRVDAAQVFRTAALVPASSFGTQEVAALSGAPAADVEAALDHLVDIHLLVGLEPGRYAFHDLIWSYAWERLEDAVPGAERDAAVRRLLYWYTRAADAAMVVIDPTPSSLPEPAPEPGVGEPPRFSAPEEAVAWFDQHAEALSAAVDAATGCGRADLAALIAIRMMAYAMTDLTFDWRGCLERALVVARQSGDISAEAWTVHRLGVCHGVWERSESCLARLQEALALHRRAGDGVGEAVALGNLASLYSQIRQGDRAIECGERALALWAGFPPEMGIKKSTPHVAIADVHLDGGRFEQAVVHYRRALDSLGTTRSSYTRAVALNNLGDAYRGLDRFEEAVASIEESLEVSTGAGIQYLQGDSLHTLGRTFHHFGRADSARDCFRQAMEIFEELGFQPGLARVRDNLARLDPAPPDAAAPNLPEPA
ncbi:Tetratricopeptide repeat-containing protein [Actinacidiphila yanglinensis]|uniref:Tetratricopeptide repeat-containing protein n=1 Tax=Actinacidiphila yanglinensis TaxID=310779 RepID=A0A1H6AIS9_9ACTN|nr:tetratricopeptide repeat protein [Actinacidiphila yanglinensis]SEG48421.1 Tetratricopeptide repeat-containing protein [Actinacidiphila yanglinensis]